jgi:4-amino-4-deoxy-L-arabinose transferase-like glycosyltransferase
LLLSIALTIPWITVGEFYTKGEPREATVAVDILNAGNWILPSGYADEFAYKPPFMHWFIAAFSLPQGHVTETTARLPSAVGLIGIVMAFFIFLYKRKQKSFAALAAIILLTSFEMHRSGIEARVDMLLTLFMVLASLSLFKWEEKGLRGYPILVPIFLGCAALVKGPVGILLPSLVFGIYLLLLRRYSLWEIIVKNAIVAIPALAILLMWYVLAYKQGGEHFFNLVYAENFGRFLGQDSKALGISYDLGHKGPFWYYIPAIILGFMPWSLLLIFAAFSVSYKGFFSKIRIKNTPAFMVKLSQLEKTTLYSIVSVVIILSFYAIPSSKRSVYIMPVYPFAAYLLAMLFEWASETKTKLISIMYQVVKVMAIIMLTLTASGAIIDLTPIAAKLIHNAKTLHDVNLFTIAFGHPTVGAIAMWFFLLAILVASILIARKEKKMVLIFTTLSLFITVQIFLEDVAFPVFKNGYSLQPFAKEIIKKYPLKDKTYVMNDLRKFRNLYGLNFYMNNNFKNFEKELPQDGYFITGSTYIDQIRETYKQYQFDELDRSPNEYNDYDDIIILYKIHKTGNN